MQRPSSYVTLTCLGKEQALADWGIKDWSREVYNQGSDTFAFNLDSLADANDPFPFGTQVIIKRGRQGNFNGQSTSPSGPTSFSGGETWFVGYRMTQVRIGSPDLEEFQYKFGGPWDYFMERITFMKLWLTWNGVKQIADWRSQVVLGLSATVLTGPGDTVQNTTATNLMSISQQLIEIAQYCISVSVIENQALNLGWTPGAQFQFDQLTTVIDGVNYDLSENPRVNCKIPDYVPGLFEINIPYVTTGPLGTSVNPNGTVLRAPLDAVNALTCAECMRKMVRWIGAVGSPVMWFDYTTSPPALLVSTRDILPSVTLPYEANESNAANPVKHQIERRDDLVPPAIAFKYRVVGQSFGASYTYVYNDIASTYQGKFVEGAGVFGTLINITDLDNIQYLEQQTTHLLSAPIQTFLQTAARRANTHMGTFDFEGFSTAAPNQVTISTVPFNPIADPSLGGDGGACWQQMVPTLQGATNITQPGLVALTGNPAYVILDPVSLQPTSVPSGYNNLLIDGGVSSWMTNQAGDGSLISGNSIRVIVKSAFSYTDPLGGIVGYNEFVRQATLTNIVGGTYSSGTTITSFGEPVPFGLAGYMYNIEKVVQYQGSYTVQEDEITDVCPMGNVLNLVGGRAEWETMNACVQSIAYASNGQTTLRFGFAEHLDYADFVERLRLSRGPRWYFLIGANVLNS